uniref:Uncharacterized protein n=1 Tax=Cyanoptyche gloeocystis TaxID=77922 RepID=A0A096Y6V1_9EUKA|nr:hypothetical protein NX25_p30 [Cyanoptyche gloeocystis]AIM52065.1 hypothetical protein [Cyanoptyche gloeocystis]
MLIFMRLYKNFQFLRSINYNKKKWKKKKIININKKSKINLINFKLYTILKRYFDAKKKNNFDLDNTFSENFSTLNNAKKINSNNYQIINHCKINKLLKSINKNSLLLDNTIVNVCFTKSNKINVCKFQHFTLKKKIEKNIGNKKKVSIFNIFSVSKKSYQFSKLFWRNFNSLCLKKMLKENSYTLGKTRLKKIYNNVIQLNNIELYNNTNYVLLYSFLFQLLLKYKNILKKNINHNLHILFKTTAFNRTTLFRPQNLFMLTKKQKILKNSDRSKNAFRRRSNKSLRLFTDKHWEKYLLYKKK